MTINTELNNNIDLAYHEEANVKEALNYMKEALEMRKSLYSNSDSTEGQILGDIQDAKEDL